MKSYNCKWKLVGLVSLGEENRSMQAIIKGQYMSKYFSIILQAISSSEWGAQNPDISFISFHQNITTYIQCNHMLNWYIYKKIKLLDLFYSTFYETTDIHILSLNCLTIYHKLIILKEKKL